jgi:HK97 family phage prohead protease
MPIPKPRKNETKDNFMDRCMGDPVTNKEFPDNKQRFGVCQTQWKEKKNMSNKKEIRSIKTPVKVETREDGTVKSIYGYPIVYNKDSEDMGFIERIAPGAATKALKNSDIRGLKNHDPSLIFARSGVNLTLKEDEKGVRMEATPIDTHNYREVAKEVELGLLDGQSFAFNILADEWKGLDTDKPTRTITEFEAIFDVGPVTYPAYQDTTVALRSMNEAKEVPPKSERIDIEVKGIKYSFENKDVLTQLVDEALKRSDVKPTLPASDEKSPGPTTEPTGDDTLNRINEAIARLEE